MIFFGDFPCFLSDLLDTELLPLDYAHFSRCCLSISAIFFNFASFFFAFSCIFGIFFLGGDLWVFFFLGDFFLGDFPFCLSDLLET